MVFFQHSRFPKYGSFISAQMTRFEDDEPFIFKAYVTALQGDRDLARKTVKDGELPTVEVVEIHPELCNFNLNWRKMAPGSFCPASPSKIHILESEAEGYENGNIPDWKAARLLLHELVHWARYHKGLPSRISGFEAGDMFEWFAQYPGEGRLPRNHDDGGPVETF
ncbi:hypothetical protein [Vannielia litorea]|uniref:hypothetical protein n=1 Tax=Vannielia litorea TaxID=1217970 RepID=UPI001BCB7132|nr:hypothetical protein [Vannielia litorea]MBS8225020.1 hypothetical protein [Vannielia litorea]